jgi:hypothetical protein
MEPQKIHFVMNVRSETKDQVRGMKESISHFYQNSGLTIIEDGAGGLPVLKTREGIGRWISRYMDWGMANNPDWLIKIDPDAKIIRAMQIPLTGNVCCAKKTYSIKGVERFMPHAGVIAFSRDAARGIQGEAVSRRYVNYPETRDDYQEEIVLKAICEEIGIEITDRPDFLCGKRRASLPTDSASFWHL